MSNQIIFGCTNEFAINYDSLANSENGTCDIEGVLIKIILSMML